MKIASITTLLAVAVTAIGLSGAARADETADKLKAAFHRCNGCHMPDKEGKTFGPTLHGVYGRKAGTVPGFEYSQGLKDSDIVWNEETLDRWLEQPHSIIIDTRMSYQGISDPGERARIIAYLKSLN